MPSAASSASKQRLPSARFLLSAATHAFLLRQHPRCLALLSQLFLSLPAPSCAWTAGERLGPRERAREDVRRQAAVLWLTSVVCFVGEAQAAAAAGHGANGSSSPHAGLASTAAAPGYGAGSLTGDSKTDDAVRSGSAAAVLRALVDRCGSLYALPSPAPLHPRRTPSSLTPAAAALRRLPSALPPQVAQTLLLASQKLALPAPTAQALVLDPFHAGLPLALQHRLAGRSRARESEHAFGSGSGSGGGAEGRDEAELWLDAVLDAYEGVVETWAVHVLAPAGAGAGGTDGAVRFVREDMVLGRSRKSDIIAALELAVHPSNSAGADNAFPYRPSSPGLSSSSSSSISSVLTATPLNPFPSSGLPASKGSSSAAAGADGDDRGRRRARAGQLKTHVDAVRRFLSPRPAYVPSLLAADATGPAVDGEADDAQEAACTSITLAPSPLPSGPAALLQLARCWLPILRLPTALAFVLSLILAFVRRRQQRLLAAAAETVVGADVRRRLARGVLGW